MTNENLCEQSGGLFEDRPLTKAEFQDRVEMGVRAALERQTYRGPHALLIKALDSNLSTDPFGGAFADEPSPLQKRARSQFYGIKKSLNEDELTLVRSHFAASPSILSQFEKGNVAVRFEDGRVAGYNLRA
jgi:hypothetical protein